MDDYYVTLRDPKTKGRWSMHFKAESFAHAEEQANDAEGSEGYEIILIEKDY